MQAINHIPRSIPTTDIVNESNTNRQCSTLSSLSSIACFSAYNAALGATGAAILSKILNNSTYNPAKAAQYGAIGGAILGVPLAAFRSCCNTEENYNNDVIVITGLALISGLIGYALDKSIGNDPMPIANVAESFPMGIAAFAGGTVALVILIVCCACLCGYSSSFSQDARSNHRPTFFSV